MINAKVAIDCIGHLLDDDPFEPKTIVDPGKGHAKRIPGVGARHSGGAGEAAKG